LSANFVLAIHSNFFPWAELIIELESNNHFSQPLHSLNHVDLQFCDPSRRNVGSPPAPIFSGRRARQFVYFVEAGQVKISRLVGGNTAGLFATQPWGNIQAMAVIENRWLSASAIAFHPQRKDLDPQ
jgi:hypothetical protein